MSNKIGKYNLQNMSTSLVNSGGDSELENKIDANIKELQKLENEILPRLETEREYLLKRSPDINDFYVSVTDEHKLVLNEMKTLDADVEAAKKLDLQIHEKIIQTELAVAKTRNQRVEDRKSYEKECHEILPIFLDGLTIYSDDNLSIEIQKIREELEICTNHKAKVDQEIDKRVSKFNHEEINSAEIARNEGAMKELSQLKAMWTRSLSEMVSSRKQRENTIQELESKIGLNERKIKNLSDNK